MILLNFYRLLTNCYLFSTRLTCVRIKSQPNKSPNSVILTKLKDKSDCAKLGGYSAFITNTIVILNLEYCLSGHGVGIRMFGLNSLCQRYETIGG